MNIFELFLNRIFSLLIRKIQFYTFLLSLGATCFVGFNLFNFNNVFGISDVYILENIFRIIVIFSTIYIILFLPTYPLFFIIFKLKDFKFLEKLSITIITNLTYYILVGYVGYYLGFSMTGNFFFITLIFSFISIILLEIYLKIKNGKYKFSKKAKDSSITQHLNKDFISLKHFKHLIPINGVLVLIFLGLICVYNIVRFSYFFGTDAWYHIFIIKKIVYMNYLPINEYYGTVGFHIFGAIIQFFSGMDLLLFPRYFVFYTFSLLTLTFYNIQMRIFKSQNLAFFGVFLLNISALSYNSHMMIQYWPTSLAVIQCLLIFFLLYVRLQSFIKVERPTREKVLSNIFFFYILNTLIFISAILTHSLIAMILLLSYLFVYLIYFLKDIRRGFDFIFLCVLMGIFLIFFNFTLISEQFWSIRSFSFPWYLIILAGMVASVLIWRIKKSILFTSGRFSSTIFGKNDLYYKKIEDKYIIPLSLSFTIIVTTLFSIVNIILFDVNISFVFWVFEILLLIIFGLWGFFLFQKKPRGKPLLIWCYGLALILGVSFFLDVFVSESKLSGRIILLLSPVISIGLASYIYKLIKLKSIHNQKTKLFIVLIISLSFCNYFFFELINTDNKEFNLTRREVNSVHWLSTYTDDKNYIVNEFGWDYIFMYYDYPFSKENENLRGRDIHYFRSNMTYLYHPKNHTNSRGENVLQKIKKEYKTDVYMILDDTYITQTGWKSYGRLTKGEMEEYYSLDYLNKIYSSKSENGEEVPFYWVI